MTQSAAKPIQIGFLGSGQMATALASAWKRAGLMHESSLASDPIAVARERFTQTTGLQAVASNLEVAQRAELIILAVKPQMLPALLNEIRPALTPAQVIVSIAAGITLRQLSEQLGTTTRLIRVMPNTPCLVNASATGIAASPSATADDLAMVSTLFNAVGRAFVLAEPLLDAVTGLSGSGPAFVYLMIEAMSDGGVRMGLPRDVATALAAQTVLGAARMVLETGSHPGVLKDQVTSPGGTTIAGIHELERGGMRAAFMNAVEAASKRATELGRG
ncbi:pyrroline-5-carboxylate reductase [Tuwongella immobilis]|uniref:Pyrroline-5-carboxylate reductase n=1 Tax=Tuwongella immobilis TaxID=692036 RepID=A0A6C2YNG8_9BACT|nr:pyrroline-5-carboxylate reductase [Tuwongella immobilis]VIP02605.1 pyrroline-5-carboxylate reductase : Pyrroline-5-carboxylate reductase OS=Chlamydomonas reinhardtii GN=PCR1 PE=1 SV=1: F420_oxidored: P5CR_dimer [Tuwongella immobilis]VTS01903.1 pyrroline-5-carboxylate reductase : Pyrroline-5-carboxylate reductase OS=Chlamydomonas reinhardtii GN=PCR1 PE=1 SV=1: F420_oxidored: P5CR_dimer [Tuwongella immobilis]